MAANVDEKVKYREPTEYELKHTSYLYHGTYSYNLSSIAKTGLQARSRMIHATPLWNDVCKMRHNTDRAVVIHVAQCLKSGVEFKISEQGVWLTWGLEMRNGYYGILPSDIHKVHCLPNWEKDYWMPAPYTELCYAAQGE